MITTRSVHEQLLEICQKQLDDGLYCVGTPFPSERELALQHGISRATANKVLARLRSEGWLEYQRGIGCFVSERPTVFASLRQLESFTSFAENNGFRPQTRVTRFIRSAKVSTTIREHLQLGSSESVIEVERLRLLNGEVVIVETRYLPAKRFPRLTQQALSTSFYSLCRERYQLTIAGESIEIRSEAAPLHHDFTWAQPILAIHGVGTDEDNIPLWYQHLSYHGKYFHLKSISSPDIPFPSISLGFRGNPPSKVQTQAIK